MNEFLNIYEDCAEKIFTNQGKDVLLYKFAKLGIEEYFKREKLDSSILRKSSNEVMKKLLEKRGWSDEDIEKAMKGCVK